MSSGIMLESNQRADIIKVYTSFFLKENNRKTNSQGGLLNIFASLTRAGLPLMKNVPTPLAKCVLMFVCMYLFAIIKQQKCKIRFNTLQ